MFQKNVVMHKVEEFVEITLAGQQPFEAVVFLSIGDRLIDLLNDARPFIPVKRMDNSTMIMSKSNILSIVEKDPFSKPSAVDEDDIIIGQNLAEALDPDSFGSNEGPSFDEETGEDSTKNDAGKGEEKDAGNKNGDQQRRRRRKKTPEFDAYAILKVSPEASLDEIRAAYKSRIKAVHPDSVAALDIDEELIRAAIHSTQKVNYAYHHILKERRTRKEDEEGRAA